jgi:hypothetical protein
MMIAEPALKTPVGSYRIWAVDIIADMFPEDTHGLSAGYQIGESSITRPAPDQLATAWRSVRKHSGLIDPDNAELEIQRYNGNAWVPEKEFKQQPQRKKLHRPALNLFRDLIRNPR